MIERDIEVVNKLGLHARASAKLVQLLAGYRCNVVLAFRGREINAKSIMGLMMLAAAKGSMLHARVDGPDEAAAMDAMATLFINRFDEPE